MKGQQTPEERLGRFSKRLAQEFGKNPRANIEKLKNSLALETQIGAVPKNAAILSGLPPSLRTPKMISLLRTRLTRTASGVTPIALMPKPFACPGKCTYCPTATKEERESDGSLRTFLFAPKAYTGFEPATMRAIQNGFDAKRQIDTRLSQYRALGQPADKCELILMGGTFLSVPRDYRNEFVKECYEAMNGKKEKTLQEAQKRNETALHRVIGLTIETRPDWCGLSQIDEMLTWGATRVELGVQSLDDAVLRKVKRGHDVKCTQNTTANLKNAAFKVGYHFMPGLYSTKEQDVSMLRELFTNPAYCPDMLKLYPCLVMEGTELFGEWKAGRFEPIDADEAVERIVQATGYFPPWVRVMRMQRDIPANKIASGVKNGNLHQMVMDELERRGEKCRCIRCRETFATQRRGEKTGKRRALDLELVERAYSASGGMEHFLSFEDAQKDVLAGFARLRLPPESHRPEISETTALIRELHVYGQEVEIGKTAKAGSSQHSGLGKKLLLRAEEIAKDAGKDKMVVISGVGARGYYRKFGYALDGPYMGKKI